MSNKEKALLVGLAGVVSGGLFTMAAGLLIPFPLLAAISADAAIIVAASSAAVILRRPPSPRPPSDPQPLPRPDAPTDLRATADVEQVHLTWAASPSTVTYNVYRGGGPDRAAVALHQRGVADTCFTDAGLAGGEAYYYQVTAVNAAGLESARSAGVSVTPLAREAAVTPRSPTRDHSQEPAVQPLLPELAAVVSAWLAVPDEMHPLGPCDSKGPGKGQWQQIRGVREWQYGRIHWEFMQSLKPPGISVELHTEQYIHPADVLASLHGTAVAGGLTTLTWDDVTSKWRHRLAAGFPQDTPPSIIAEAMRELIKLTEDRVTASLRRPH
jgi:hypothetical protein